MHELLDRWVVGRRAGVAVAGRQGTKTPPTTHQPKITACLQCLHGSPLIFLPSAFLYMVGGGGSGRWWQVVARRGMVATVLPLSFSFAGWKSCHATRMGQARCRRQGTKCKAKAGKGKAQAMSCLQWKFPLLSTVLPGMSWPAHPTYPLDAKVCKAKEAIASKDKAWHEAVAVGGGRAACRQ